MVLSNFNNLAKKNIFIFIYILCCSNTYGQTKLKVISETDNSNLPFATITDKKKMYSYSSNGNGEILLDAKIGDTLQITYVGFVTKYHIISTNNDIVKLVQNNSILKPIVISNCKKINTDKINNFKNVKKVDNNFGGYSASYGIGSSNYAIHFKNSTKDYTLSKFSFWLKNYLGPDSVVFAPFLISIYEVNDTNDLPTIPVLEKPIFYFPSKVGKQTIDLDSLHIKIPEKGIYISFQYIMDEKYSWNWKTKWGCPSCVDTVIKMYGGILEGAYNTGYKSLIYNFFTNEWIKQKPTQCIKFEAVLKYCKN